MNIKRAVKEAKKGDEEAFLLLINFVKESLYRTAFRYFGNEHDALDAVQEVTCKAYLKIDHLRKAEQFKGWMLRMMINHCNDVWKKRKRNIPVEEIFYAGFVENNDDQLILMEMLLKLEPKIQEIIHLKYFDDWTIKQIADWKKVPEGTIKTWLNRGLQHLRVEWEKGEESHG
ncbi:RNA polymerase sigma-70 factor (ECF subfamily) [Salirhabdus euzebyi]|uniref:RNA polymerase sigma-70 factor (ECF subfamily) n=1 Tax=Salirhabdus euzebyi TaxID=394506 RepID=A0A841Q8Z4_9BACI|nr:sigma-70 family RNA polymerase sigma factor [Salirhabdus euzebyi]MBB6454845.1 RNA polymerase sigma-70 factor (ECF subfamily) [Salirhabdus euzebyi]